MLVVIKNSEMDIWQTLNSVTYLEKRKYSVTVKHDDLQVKDWDTMQSLVRTRGMS